MLKEKNIVVGVTGGIAVYKAVEVARRLRKAGALVHVIMTRAAANFVTPLTFREISGRPVVAGMWDEAPRHEVEHIALATLADLFLIAPATANVIGKLAAGLADDMLTTTVLATKAPVLIAPAMNSNMYEHPLVQENLAKLIRLGYRVLPPECGPLACGVSGPGRLPPPEAIVGAAEAVFAAAGELAGKKVLVTAGGTIEPLDPVRFIGNRSSGKMGYAVARAAAGRGAMVTLVSGPAALPPPPGVAVRRVETAAEMRAAVLEAFAAADITVKAAAVADYRPRQVAAHKIKKSDAGLSIELEKTPDILYELGQLKTDRQVLIGFAAETRDLTSYAADKMRRKNLDMIVANNVALPGAGFNADTNIAKLLYRDGRIEDLPCMTKDALAELLFDKIRQFIKN